MKPFFLFILYFELVLMAGIVLMMRHGFYNDHEDGYGYHITGRAESALGKYTSFLFLSIRPCLVLLIDLTQSGEVFGVRREHLGFHSLMSPKYDVQKDRIELMDILMFGFTLGPFWLVTRTGVGVLLNLKAGASVPNDLKNKA